MMTCAFFDYRGSVDEDHAIEGKSPDNRRRRCYGGVRTRKTQGCGARVISKYGSFFFLRVDITRKFSFHVVNDLI